MEDEKLPRFMCVSPFTVCLCVHLYTSTDGKRRCRVKKSKKLGNFSQSGANKVTHKEWIECLCKFVGAECDGLSGEIYAISNYLRFL